MTPDERQMLSDLFERIRSTSGASRDSQAEAFINDAMRAQPYAPYVLSQTVIVQQHALEEAQRRIQELEEQARNSSAQPQQETSFLGRLFGGGASASQTPAPSAGNSYDASAYQRGSQPPPQQDYGQQQGYAQQPRYAPQPQGYAPQQQGYAPQQQGYAPQPSGPWGAPSGGGSGFLGSALQTATGVAGGMLAANAIEGLLGGRRGGGLFGGGGGTEFVDTGPREVVNNYYSSDSSGRSTPDNSSYDNASYQDDGFSNADDSGGWGDDNSSGGSYDT